MTTRKFQEGEVLKIQHYGAKDLFLDIVAWLCETRKSSFAFGLGLGLLSNSVPIIFFLPFFAAVVFIGYALRRLVQEEKIPPGAIPAFLFGCITGIFVGTLIVVAWLEHSEGNL